MREPVDLPGALSRAALALGRTLAAEEVARVAIAETQRATGIEAVALHLLNEAGDALILREFAGTTPDFREQVRRLPLAQAQVAAKAIQGRRPVTCAVPAEPARELDALYVSQGFRHLTVVPVEGRERVLGVLHLAGRSEAALDDEALAAMQAIGGLVGLALENVALHETMSAQRDRLRALAEGTIRAREEEARRIAHELHDEASQLLASVHIALDELARDLRVPGTTIARLHGMLDRVEDQLRRLSRELRPTILDDLGLAPALEWLARGVSERSGVPIAVEAPVGRLPAAVETAIYRMVQEGLTNALRHAGATAVEVGVHQADGWVEVEVRDNGRGFDVEASLARRGERGLGLIGMRERAEMLGGRLRIASSLAGTALSLRVPIAGTAP